MIVVLFGPPGSGKGSQAHYLVDKFNFVHISTGDLLRKHIQNGSKLGEQFKTVINSGEFISDDVINKLCFKEITENAEKNIVLDGFPRTLGQAKALDDFLQTENLKIAIVFYLNLDILELEKRIKGRFSCANCNEVYHSSFRLPKLEGICDACGKSDFIKRLDDDSEVLQNRIKIYLNETDVLKEYYKGKKLLKEIDGSYDMSTVSKNIINCLDQADFKI